MKNLVLVLLLLNITFAFGQKKGNDLSTKSKKAKAHFENAVKFFNYNQPEDAMSELDKALVEDSTFYEVYQAKAEFYNLLKKYDSAAIFYKKAIHFNPDSDPMEFYYLGSALYQANNYKECLKYLNKFLSLNRGGAENDFTLKAVSYAQISEVRDSLMSNPVPFNPINMGPNINSIYHEYLPSLTADENVLIFTRRVIRNPERPYNSPGNAQEDFYEAHRVNGKWQPAFNIGPPVNTPGNEGAECISADGKMLFFASDERTPGAKSIDIFMSKRLPNGGWSEPESLGSPINTEYWDTQPSFSSDGKTLYFISNRPGGYGGQDIWKSELQSDGSWSRPENLGPNVNSKGDESAPFIHPDGVTLYFGTNGRIGMGGMDIFYSRLNPNGTWDKAKNIGYPINSSGRDDCLIVNPNGNMAYCISDRPGGIGGLDLYSFDLYEAARPVATTYFKGKVYDAVTKEPLEARFELIDLAKQKQKMKSNSSKSGEFLISLPTNNNYALNVSKDGYLFYSQNFSMKDHIDKSKPYLMDVPLQPIGMNEVVVMRNIFFDTDKYDLRSESMAELSKLVALLKNNPALKIEVMGHTDNVGDDAKNMKLSENRAKSVCDYLISKGVEQSRVKYKGYGKTVPLKPNDTDENRQLNRRTEFKIIGK